jgi:hypothetical protein
MHFPCAVSNKFELTWKVKDFTTGSKFLASCDTPEDLEALDWLLFPICHTPTIPQDSSIKTPVLYLCNYLLPTQRNIIMALTNMESQ